MTDAHVHAWQQHTQRLAASCFPLAHKLANDYARTYALTPEFREDLASAALVGVCRAARKFDAALGFKFVTCAYRDC